MILLDLKWFLFALIALVLAAGLLALAVDRWSRRRARALPEFGDLQPALERAPLGLLVLQDLRTCRYLNPAARRLLGIERNGSPPYRLPDAPWMSLLDEDRAAARQGMAATGRYRSVPLDADRHVRWWVTPLDDLDLVLLLDAAPLQSDQAARFLLSDLSHELRTPLATLLTHLQVLRLTQIPEGTRQQSIQLMEQEAKRMTRLVHNLLELGRLETSAEIERRPVDLHALVEGVVGQVAAQAEERGITLSLQAATPLPLAIGDADRLRQVFLNLLDNACKYSRPGDRVIVSLQCSASRQEIACEVRDSGPGIPAEHLPHLTRRFYRVASEEVGGSGLGLAVVEEILRRHQTRLSISSQNTGPETGTCIRFDLPALVEREDR